jgi:hypothetical protein
MDNALGWGHSHPLAVDNLNSHHPLGRHGVGLRVGLRVGLGVGGGRILLGRSTRIHSRLRYVRLLLLVGHGSVSASA